MCQDLVLSQHSWGYLTELRLSVKKKTHHISGDAFPVQFMLAHISQRSQSHKEVSHLPTPFNTLVAILFPFFFRPSPSVLPAPLFLLNNLSSSFYNLYVYLNENKTGKVPKQVPAWKREKERGRERKRKKQSPHTHTEKKNKKQPQGEQWISLQT